MSTEQKVTLAWEAEGEHALSSVLEALELPRSTWYYHQNHRVSYSAKYAHLREPLETIAREHPEYGYRRTTAELREAIRPFGVGCSDPQKLDRCDSSSRISPKKGDTRCQSEEHTHRSSRPRWSWKS